MIHSKEALSIILQHVPNYGVESIGLTDSIGRVLAEDILADRPFPPFNRVCMDGIAIQHASFEHGQTIFPIEKTLGAGQAIGKLLNPKACIEIMTGAPLPENTDTVIRYEDLKKMNNSFEVLVSPGKGKNIHLKGGDQSAGEVVLPKNFRIKAIDVNVLASVGQAIVPVWKNPKIAVVSSGNELVDVDVQPLDHQIRKSNAAMILARLRQMGIEGQDFHIQDEVDDIASSLATISEQFDVILISGGVSKGKFDFIPDELAKLGYEKLFHQVRQRPGKPFWFGKKEGNLVFAFPGNPISTLACFHKYFIPWLQQSLGLSYERLFVTLAETVNFAPALTYFAQASLSYGKDGKLSAQVKHGNGSGDLVNPVHMDGFIEFPAEPTFYQKGEVFPFIPFHPIFV